MLYFVEKTIQRGDLAPIDSRPSIPLFSAFQFNSIIIMTRMPSIWCCSPTVYARLTLLGDTSVQWLPRQNTLSPPSLFIPHMCVLFFSLNAWICLSLPLSLSLSLSVFPHVDSYYSLATCADALLSWLHAIAI